jgi:hypothetical protein
MLLHVGASSSETSKLYLRYVKPLTSSAMLILSHLHLLLQSAMIWQTPTAPIWVSPARTRPTFPPHETRRKSEKSSTTLSRIESIMIHRCHEAIRLYAQQILNPLSYVCLLNGSHPLSAGPRNSSLGRSIACWQDTPRRM